eukprot:TRINITY_DN8251_c0_g1_i9.p1 TRINITY_DN8251_c0_g1~~TRINITY_DN8251_c0_g1_i9.p1  ORF type:complete len:651 (+),score=173.86 TRINITY_DN8251_c0_g1_i9:76-2028(+)
MSNTVKNNNNNNNNNPITLSSTELDPQQKTKTTQHKKKGKECKTEYVTVYNDRAEVVRLVEVSFSEPGNHEIIIEGLSADILPESIRISGGEGDAAILEVSNKEVIGGKDDTSETAVLIKQLRDIADDTCKVRLNFDRIKKSRQWLLDLSASLVKSPQNAINSDLATFLDGTTEFMTYYADQLRILDESESTTTAHIKENEYQKQLIKKKIAQLQQHHLSTSTREITVVLHCAGPASSFSPVKVAMHMSYIITGAQWIPSYDVRMSSYSDSLQMAYFGSIINASGEDWDDVQLTLSTAAPSIGGAPPHISELRVSFPNYNVDDYYRSRSSSPQKPQITAHQKQIQSEIQGIEQMMQNNLEDMLNRGETYDSVLEQQNNMLNEQTEVVRLKSAVQFSKQSRPQNAFLSTIGRGLSEKSEGGSMTVLSAEAETVTGGVANSSFVIPRKSSIPSDNKPHKVMVATLDLKAKLTHYATPNTSSYVYLKATAVNTTDAIPFLAGSMNIFMNQNFVATSTIDVVSPQEKFHVFLGVDPGVRLDVKPVRRFQQKQTGFISKYNAESVTFSATVKNTRKDPIKLTAVLQVPVSTDNRITVKLVEPDIKVQESVGNIKRTAKFLQAKYTLAANQVQELTYKYSVEWPVGQNIVHVATNP